MNLGIRVWQSQKTNLVNLLLSLFALSLLITDGTVLKINNEMEIWQWIKIWFWWSSSSISRGRPSLLNVPWAYSKSVKPFLNYYYYLQKFEIISGVIFWWLLKKSGWNSIRVSLTVRWKQKVCQRELSMPLFHERGPYTTHQWRFRGVVTDQ